LIWDRKETKSATFYYKFNSSVLLRRSHNHIEQISDILIDFS